MNKEEMIEKVNNMSDEEIYKFIAYLIKEVPSFEKDLAEKLQEVEE